MVQKYKGYYDEYHEKIKMLEKVKNNLEDYPYFNKIMHFNSFKKLKDFLFLANERAIAPKKLLHDNKYAYFTLTLKELTRRKKRNKGNMEQKY